MDRERVHFLLPGGLQADPSDIIIINGTVISILSSSITRARGCLYDCVRNHVLSDWYNVCLTIREGSSQKQLFY